MLKSSCRLIIFILLLTVFLFLQNSLATTLRKLSLEELVSESDLILVGKCEKVETVWLDKKIYTIATIRVSQSAKGDNKKDEIIKVHILGGRVKEPIPVKMHVLGAAKVSKDEEMILFLQKREGKKSYNRITGMAQGKVPVITDKKTGEKVVHYAEPVKGVKMVDRDGKPVAVPEEPDEAKKGNLDSFLGTIKRILDEQEKEEKVAPGTNKKPQNKSQDKKGGAK